MRRRETLAALLALCAGAPLGLRAQARVRQIGFLGPLSAAEAAALKEVFLQGMREQGYTTGKDFVLVERYADRQYERLAGMAAELVQLKVDLSFASTLQAVGAAQKATSSIPIVFVAVSDPVKLGFADSVPRPGRC